jgi:hypothetical protein
MPSGTRETILYPVQNALKNKEKHGKMMEVAAASGWSRFSTSRRETAGYSDSQLPN